jgi:hypothetical protein
MDGTRDARGREGALGTDSSTGSGHQGSLGREAGLCLISYREPFNAVKQDKGIS